MRDREPGLLCDVFELRDRNLWVDFLTILQRRIGWAFRRSGLCKQNRVWQQSYRQRKHPRGKQGSHRQKSDYTRLDSPSRSRKTIGLAGMRGESCWFEPLPGRDCRSWTQNKTPRTLFESWAYVDQPSPKCCSITRLSRVHKCVNGSVVPYRKTNGKVRCKTKRPRLCLSHGTYVDQPSPKCCSITRLSRVHKRVHGPAVL
jgi:hypothetical protein